MNLRHAFTPVDNHRLSHLCGTLDEHLRAIEVALQVRISHRGEQFQIEGDKPAAQRTLGLLQSLYARADRPIAPESLRLAIVEAAGDVNAPTGDGEKPGEGGVVLRTRRADLAGRTPNQHQYLHQILSHDISFGIGPAGTGKTFLAVACAVDALERSSVQRIILTRPAVEAGERLGFLPGDLAQKVDPYLRPLYDALYDLMGFDRVTKAFEKGQLEIAPLAFMRGRTLNHAFVILDEAQNTTPEQMKMFLTRIGFGSKCVVTGDTSQIDLPRGMVSGLVDAQRVLDGVDGIAMTRFTRADVVRHPLVARIVQAYEERQSARQLQEAQEAQRGQSHQQGPADEPPMRAPSRTAGGADAAGAVAPAALNGVGQASGRAANGAERSSPSRASGGLATGTRANGRASTNGASGTAAPVAKAAAGKSAVAKKAAGKQVVAGKAAAKNLATNVSKTAVAKKVVGEKAASGKAASTRSAPKKVAAKAVGGGGAAGSARRGGSKR